LVSVGDGDRWLLIAASSRGAAEAYAERAGISVSLVLDRRDLLAPPWRMRARMAAAGVNRAAIHSLDWSRERAPQLAELGLGLTPTSRRTVIDERSGKVEPITGKGVLNTVASLCLELPGLAADIGTAAARTLRGASAVRPAASVGPMEGLVAIWPGSSASVGGAVTHMAGILGAFKRAGLRVGLASAGPVPEQLAAAVHEFHVIPPLGRAHRLSADAELFAIDSPLLDAARRIADEMDVDFIYQRHRALLQAGARLSADRNLPLVLEWNASEVWMRKHWDRPALRFPPLERLVAASELRSLRSSTVVAAISNNASKMAFDAGAHPDQVEIVPNAVDIDEVNAILDDGREGRHELLVGWIGSFGPWHGAPVLIQALPHAPSVRLRMIGDGRLRPAVESTARELQVHSRIEWLGSLPHSEALLRLAECDVLAAPHIAASDTPFFGSPTKLFEYMALSRPIVASRLEQLGEVIDDEKTGLLVPPGDAVALGRALSRIARMPDRGAALGERASAVARAHHTWQHRATQILVALQRAAVR
jgi:glycosyltransferase involved in cell wall biosynthesis